MKRALIITAMIILAFGVALRGMRPMFRSQVTPASESIEEALESSLVQSSIQFTKEQRSQIVTMSPLPQLQRDSTNRFSDDPQAVRLGHYLFYDARLSAKGQVSCATCHDPDLGFSNGQAFGQGIRTTQRHVPTLLNVAYQRWFYWDGRADSLWAQAVTPLEHDDEMGFDRMQLAHLLHSDSQLREAYEAVYGALPDVHDELRFPQSAKPLPESTGDSRHRAWLAMAPDDQHAVTTVLVNIAKALAAYQRTLLTAPAPFDHFVHHLRNYEDELANLHLSPSAQRGLHLFIGAAQCHLCHSGPLFSDLEFHSIGMPSKREGSMLDPGRFEAIALVQQDPFNAAGRFSDDPSGASARRIDSLVQLSDVWGAFKTPTLRNVALTEPYMREGQKENLEAVVRFYSTLEDAVQLGHHHQEQILQPLHLTDQQVDDLVAFLGSLTSPPLPEFLRKQPPTPLVNDEVRSGGRERR